MREKLGIISKYVNILIQSTMKQAVQEAATNAPAPCDLDL